MSCPPPPWHIVDRFERASMGAINRVGCQNSAEQLSSPPVVVVQHPAEPFATLDVATY